MERFDLVQKAYDELVTEGVIRRVNDESFEAQKGAITRRAAYYLNQYDSGWGLLEKTSGNNSMGLSVDIVIHKDGRYADIVTDREVSTGYRQAFPVDALPKIDTSLVPRWIQPTRALAGLRDTHVDTPHTDTPPPTQNEEDIFSLLETLVRQVVKEELAKIKFPVYEGTINLRRFFGTAQITLTPKEE